MSEDKIYNIKVKFLNVIYDELDTILYSVLAKTQTEAIKKAKQATGQHFIRIEDVELQRGLVPIWD